LEQEDYLKRQIDQLGRVLGKILAEMTGLTSQGKTGITSDMTDQALKKELGLGLDDLVTIQTEKFIQTLQETRKVSDENFEKLAGIFFLLAEEPDLNTTSREYRQKLYERALMIYEHLEQTSSTYSFDRHTRMDKIKNVRYR
jgi:hypothetical protein